MIAPAQIETAPRVPSADGFGKPKSSLLAIFNRKRRESLFWFIIAAAAWLWAAWDRRALIAQLAQRRDVVVLDSLGTYYVSPVVDIQHAKDLHAWQTKLACKALFERTPSGLENPELFKQLFLKDAAKAAEAVLETTAPEFQAKSLHQMVETDPPEVLSTRDNAFYTAVDVQLIRVGAFQGEPITEVMHYRVKFKFVPNPDLTRNGRFPTAVSSFQVERADKT